MFVTIFCGSQVTSLGSKSKNQEIEWKLIAKNEDERVGQLILMGWLNGALG